MKTIVFIFTFILLFVSITDNYAQTKVKFDKGKFERNLIGQHGITLQWVSWDFRGIVKITEENNVLKIKGEQKSKDGKEDYVSIDGTLEAISDRELKFVGKITTKVHYNNSGTPCEKDGVHTFKRTGMRKYFRLQEMQNCDGVVVDYVDLYF